MDLPSKNFQQPINIWVVGAPIIPESIATLSQVSALRIDATVEDALALDDELKRGAAGSWPDAIFLGWSIYGMERPAILEHIARRTSTEFLVSFALSSEHNDALNKHNIWQVGGRTFTVITGLGSRPHEAIKDSFILCPTLAELRREITVRALERNGHGRKET